MIQKISDFERVICLCLDKRIDRFYSLQQQWRDIGIEVEPFITGEGLIFPEEQYSVIHNSLNISNTEKCYFNHIKMLEYCKKDNIKNAIFLEDDCYIKEDFINIFNNAIAYINKEKLRWDLLYLRANHTWAQTEEITENLLRLRGGTYCLHAFAINTEYINMFEKLLKLPYLPNYGPLDYWIAKNIQTNENFHCYSLWPNLAIQSPGYSYLVGADQDYEQYFLSKGSPWKK